MIIEEEVSGNEELEIDGVKLDRLKKFKETVDSTGLVAKNDILSLEEFVGPVLSNRYNINSFSSIGSVNMVREVSAVVNDIIVSNEERLSYSPSDLYKLVMNTRLSVMRLKIGLDSIIKSDSYETIINNMSRMEFRYVYGTDDSLVDIYDVNIIEAFRDSDYRLYFKSIGLTIDYDKLEQLDNDDMSSILLSFFSKLLETTPPNVDVVSDIDDEYVAVRDMALNVDLELITVKKWVYIISNLDRICVHLEALVNGLQKVIDKDLLSDEGFANSRIKGNMNYYRHLKLLFEDTIGRAILMM